MSRRIIIQKIAVMTAPNDLSILNDQRAYRNLIQSCGKASLFQSKLHPGNIIVVLSGRIVIWFRHLVKYACVLKISRSEFYKLQEQFWLSARDTSQSCDWKSGT